MATVEFKDAEGDELEEVSPLHPLPVAPSRPPLLLEATYEFARPADTSVYIALDTIATSTIAAQVVIRPLDGALVGPGNVGAMIVGAKIETNQKGCVARFRVHLFTVKPAAIADNSPFLHLYLPRYRLGYVDFPACSSEDSSNSTSARAQYAGMILPINVPEGVPIYPVFETLDAFTPASGQLFYLSLIAGQV